ncbi:anion permease [Treponema sp.]|uniref:SLC13 family permease n=1 Tax=Treponema sp. TaxID=166 RepID=UPI00298D8E34|nr:anion permease [Treponema sp.]MCQ2240857.1 anion permease [Treponema sp.]
MSIKVVVGIIAILACVLVAVFQSKKTWFTTGAALIVLLIGTFAPDTVFHLPEDILALDGNVHSRSYAFVHAVQEVINWNAVMLCLGSMMISSVLAYSKVAAHAGSSLAKRSSNLCGAVVSILVVSAVVSAFIGNISAVIIMVPVAVAFSRGAGIKPGRLVAAVAMISNIEVAATLAASPESAMFAGYSGFRFNDFFIFDGRVSFFVICQVAMVAGCAFFYFAFSKNRKNRMEIHVENLVSWVPSIIFGIMIAGLSFMSSFRHRFECATGLFVLLSGLVSVLWFKITQKKTAGEVAEVLLKTEWKMILFLMGTFILAAAVREVGIIADMVKLVSDFAGDVKGTVFVILLVVSILVSAFVDNVIYVAVILPFASVYALGIEAEPELFTFALLLGSCIGSCVTPVGSSANKTAVDMLEEQGEKIAFVDWLKTGIPFALVTALVSGFFLWNVWN